MSLLIKTRALKVLRHPQPISYMVDHFFRHAVATLALRFPKFLDLVSLRIRRNGYALRISSTPFSVLLYRYPEYFREDETFIQTYLSEGDVYVDVGANIGTTTLAAAAIVGAPGHVHAIEAHPRTFRNLERSIAINPDLKNQITVYQYALGNDSGTVTFTDMQQDDINHVSEDGGVSVPLASTDTVLENVTGRIALLKVDVEGYEKHVFEGAVGTLDRSDAVYFESYEENFKKYGYTFSTLYDLLSARGFRIYTLRGLSLGQQVDRGYRTVEEYENLIALRDEEVFARRMSS